MEQERGLKLPRTLQVDFSHRVQQVADGSGREVTGAMIWSVFEQAYHLAGIPKYQLLTYEDGGARRSGTPRTFAGRIRYEGEEMTVSGRGNGLISATIAALKSGFGLDLEVIDYQEHALKHGTDSQAVAYLECRTGDNRRVFGVGIDDDVATASVRAVLSAACNA